MKKIIKITESDLMKIVKKIILENERKLSEEMWEEIWFKLKKINKSFGTPDKGLFTFGGLFFNYSKDGCLHLPPQKLSDWREDTQKAAEILDDYVHRIKGAFRELEEKYTDKETGESNLKLRLKVGENFSMKIYKEE